MMMITTSMSHPGVAVLRRHELGPHALLRIDGQLGVLGGPDPLVRAEGVGQGELEGGDGGAGGLVRGLPAHEARPRLVLR
jgi:hypothetical protein